jgi:hypothetical protein
MSPTSRIAVAALALALAAGSVAVILLVPAQAIAAAGYKDCAALNAHYGHGVALPGARDYVRGRTKPVTTFTPNKTVYLANRRLDGIACEKR